MVTKLPLSLDYGYLAPNVTMDAVLAWQDMLKLADDKVLHGGGLGAGFLGWVQPKDIVPAVELAQIKQIAKRIQDNSDVLISIGIGGSYLGSRAVIEALGQRSGTKVEFAGQSLSSYDHNNLMRSLDGKRFSINAISKSGTTTEPAVAFRLFRDLLHKSVGAEEAKNRIIATTDVQKGALRKFADQSGYESFSIGDDIGGRYSVLSPVGLLPIAVAGIDIDALLAGAQDVADASSNPDVSKNPVLFYAALRNMLYRKGFVTEILAAFEPRLHFVSEWWKQLFGESEGKDHMALFPASVAFTTDLHSMGQWIQEGRRNIIETFVILDGGEPELRIPRSDSDLDELGYLAGRTLEDVNRAAYEATSLAHWQGGVPNSTLHVSKLDAYSLGALLYFFERACGISGYLMGINPFDQPGVEAYKKNMFALLGKPTFEQQSQAVKQTIASLPKNTVVSFGG